MIDVALVEYEINNNEIITSSGMVFSEKYVLITSHVLLPFIKQFDLDEWFDSYDAGIIYHNIFRGKVKPKLHVTTKNECTTTRPAKVIAGFICQNIMNTCRTHLQNWAVEFEINTYHAKELLSLFFILEIQQGISNSYRHESSEQNLNYALFNLLHDAGKLITPSTGLEVFIKSVPFGNSTFLNSYSQGIISNVVGDNSCLLLTDSPSTPGSEGSPVFVKTLDKERPVVAIVISCVNWWKGEWVGLTLTANLVPLLTQFKELGLSKTIQNSRPLAHSKLIGLINHCLLQVTNRSLWGTAILIDKENGIFLTNSHVIESNQVVLHWQKQKFNAVVVYKTPNAEVYDLAVLQCNPSSLKGLSVTPARISVKPTEVGEDVFAAGFPLFQSMLNPQPTVTKGSISKIYRGMLNTTCCVLPGTSGGAIFRSNGELVAVVVSNVKINETGVVYPHLNMAIPILAIYSIIQDYLNKKDITSLRLLHCSDSNIIREWNHLPSKL